ncbi:MAG TPA: prolyl oligopeptidase family serine peptidase [Nakamurella sp.]|nr:prolyl oligopeptidase family serine peptidase [Nakamurella sp.]
MPESSDLTSSGEPTAAAHPVAAVPTALFDNPAAESRWRARYSATRMSLPSMARDAQHRTVYVSNATGRYEVYCWDVTTDRHTVLTDRPDGTAHAQLSADGEHVWWFDDTAGDEYGVWRVQPFGSGPKSAGDGTENAAAQGLPGVAAGYPAGLEVGTHVVVGGFSDDEGTRVHLARDGSAPDVVYQHPEDGGVGALSADETIWVLSHSEHGDARYPALRAIAVANGAVLGELSDAPGRGLIALMFSPVPGDQRLLVGHERRGRHELLIWDLTSGTVTELDVDLPGDLDADFYPDGSAVLVVHTHAGRTSLHRFSVDDGELALLPAARGVVSGAVARRDGSVWYRWSSAAEPGQVRALWNDGTDDVLLRPDGALAPGSERVTDVWVDGPGGRIHALLAEPPARPGGQEQGAAGQIAGGQIAGGDDRTGRPWPTVYAVHGGPATGDEDSFDANRAAWLDAGFAVVQVNYRGSTGYGSAWRDALAERVGHVELADIAAVQDHLVAAGIIDRERCAIFGYSWGGYLALLGLGVQPDRWAAGVAGVPVADYVAAYEDEMEPLRAYDRALFGGSPREVPEKYRDSSPLSYVDRVRAPLLVLAGENDPRCPIRQIDNYLDALAARGARYAVYRYDAGHGSMVVDERLRQCACEIAFVRNILSPG